MLTMDCIFIVLHRKNCKGNPHCLVGLGERKWFAEIDDSAWHNIENPNDERREKVRKISNLDLYLIIRSQVLCNLCSELRKYQIVILCDDLSKLKVELTINNLCCIVVFINI